MDILLIKIKINWLILQISIVAVKVVTRHPKEKEKCIIRSNIQAFSSSASFIAYSYSVICHFTRSPLVALFHVLSTLKFPNFERM